MLEQMGGKDLLASTSAMLAQVSYLQDRLEEASHFCRVTREAAADQDLAAQVVGIAAYAKILARRGRGEEAETLARGAVELAARTDFLVQHGDAWLDLAEVLQLNEQPQEADNALRAGLKLYEQKGNLVSAERARMRLEGVRSA
jgi:ATP/maltotriose-dependent transcriptional regulator MalT